MTLKQTLPSRKTIGAEEIAHWRLADFSTNTGKISGYTALLNSHRVSWFHRDSSSSSVGARGCDHFDSEVDALAFCPAGLRPSKSMWDTSANAGRASDYSDSNGGHEKRKRKDRDEDTPKRNRKGSKRSRSDSEAESDSDSENEREKRKKHKKKWKNGDEGNEDGDENLEMSDVERKGRSKALTGPVRARARSRFKSKLSIRSKRKRSSSPVDVTESFLQEDYGAYVYCAIRQERLAAGGGWLAQTPCCKGLRARHRRGGRPKFIGLTHCSLSACGERSMMTPRAAAYQRATSQSTQAWDV
ncbi:hypothetical protein C8Q74DRAFT_1219168 [Fomes fomentarius]|nr:hypothetical protein C8Q74DRAFT_1219168 [Fomes fomentarius]